MSKYILAIFTLLLSTVAPHGHATEDAGLTALKNAKAQNKFLVAYFYDSTDQTNKTRDFKPSVEQAAASLHTDIAPVYIDLNNKADKALVTKFRINFAPKPIVLVLAPNGGVVGSFQKAFSAEQLKSSLPGPGMQACLKGLQEGKMVMVSVQNSHSIDAAAALKGATDFSNDPRFKAHVVSVTVDPGNKAEANTLKQLQIAPGTTKATSLLLSPPGSLIGKWEGAVSKDAIALQLTQFMSRAGQAGHACGTPNCNTPCPPPAK